MPLPRRPEQQLQLQQPVRPRVQQQVHLQAQRLQDLLLQVVQLAAQLVVPAEELAEPVATVATVAETRAAVHLQMPDANLMTLVAAMAATPEMAATMAVLTILKLMSFKTT